MEDSIKVKLEAAYDNMKSGLAQSRQFVKDAAQGMRDELKAMSDQSRADMKSSESGVEQFGNVVSSRFKGVNGAIAGVRAMWAQLAVVVGAGLLAQKAIDETVKFTTEAQRLGRALNIDASEASSLAIAIGDVYGTTDQYIGLMQGLNRQLRGNEEAVKAMGVETRDSSGHLKNQQTLLLDSLEVLRSYKEGTDRNLAAQQLFGRGVDVSSEMLALNAQRIEDAKRKSEELGLVVGEQNVEATNAFRAALNDCQDVILAAWKAVGDALIPALTELFLLFSDIGPTAVLAIKIAIGILVSIFHGLSFAVKSVWNVVKGFFTALADFAGASAKMWKAILGGDIDGALAARDELWASLKANASETFGAIADDAQETTDKVFNLFKSPDRAKGAEGQGTREFVNPKDKDGDDGAAARKAAAEAKRIAEEAYRDKQDILRQELQDAEGHYDEMIRIARKMADNARDMYGEDSKEYRNAARQIVQIEREKAAELARIKQIQKDTEDLYRQASIDDAERQADLEVALGTMSMSERLGAALDFEDQRFQISLQALNDRLAMMDAETEAYARQQQTITELKLQHEARMKEIQTRAQLEQRAPVLATFNAMQQGFEQVGMGIVNRQLTLRQATTQIFRQIYTAYMQDMVIRPLAAQAMKVIRETALGKLLMTQQIATQAAASTATVAAKSAETSAVVTGNAAQAGSGAAASQASIPYIGPILAIAAMGAIMAAVMALKGGGGGGTSGSASIPSAANGFDIPAGMNPLTQLHEREMVLPAEHADAVRDMANGGGGGGGMTVHLNIQALDGQSVMRVLKNNPAAVAGALRAIARDGNGKVKF